MFVERLKIGIGLFISDRELPVQVADNDHARPEAGFERNRSTLRGEVYLTVESRPIALGKMGKIGGDVCPRRSVMTGHRKASYLQRETFDGLLRMNRPPGNSNGILIYNIGGREIDLGYQRCYLGANCS